MIKDFLSLWLIRIIAMFSSPLFTKLVRLLFRHLISVILSVDYFLDIKCKFSHGKPSWS